VWVEAEGVSERAAMHIPVRLDGTEGWFQMDTGLDVTLLYGDIATRRGWEAHEGMYHVPRVELGGMDLGPTWLRCDEDMGGAGELSGSLGLDLLIGTVVLIDYPGRRLALMRHGEVPRWMWRRATWTPAAIRDAKFFLTVTLGGWTVEGLIFDTGASAFDIVTDLDTWRELTGRDGSDDASIHWNVHSWGRGVTAVGAPALGPLVIGSTRIDEPCVFYVQEQPRLFANWPFTATGLVGNAPFWDHVVIIDLGIRPRFGMLRE
jgi:hypothetical protein